MQRKTAHGTGDLFLSVEEAARRLGTTSTRVLIMLKSRELFGVMREGEWLVDRRSLERVDTSSLFPSGAHSGCRGGAGCAAGTP